MTALGFLDLPVELRLQIYLDFLADCQTVQRRTQPSNIHLRLPHTCRQIDQEAGPIFRRYVSLLHEHQIQTFLHSHPSQLPEIEWADVANDGRVLQSAGPNREADTPLSSLYVALGRMTSLKRLRVFQCRQGLPYPLAQGPHIRKLGLHFERALFPKLSPSLTRYELQINPETRVELFDTVSPDKLVAMRLSGNIVSPPSSEALPVGTFAAVPALRYLVLHGITGNFFDRHTLDECFPGARLESFSYALGHRLGFEIRNHHLESLATAYGSSLRKLVLLGCSRLSTTTITHCLQNLPALEYFALKLVTVDELRSNFVLSLSLPPRLAVFKLQVLNAWYAIPLREEERGLCDAIESVVLLRDAPLHHVCVCFRTQLMVEDGRQERWARIARDRGIRLAVGPWQGDMADRM
ncbi:hypothetical protein ONZ51_g2227 [Trametes cubensis]|uniref:F-box domain-containing protein n=1 Tax=Trametes cubensis TaxID=1111947 RepID=A0AAD7U2E7_9APHY|nr:hypothetical protein ONZ51_g2227 [Trametes cubensis]